MPTPTDLTNPRVAALDAFDAAHASLEVADTSDGIARVLADIGARALDVARAFPELYHGEPAGMAWFVREDATYRAALREVA